MDIEERLKTLESEFQITKEELKQILLDIRTFVMDAQSPIPNDLEREHLMAFCAENEVEKAFPNSSIYLEKLFIRPRHIEVQIFGDDSGNIVVLGERDCSIQRRHQKLIEESPAPGISEELREKMFDAAMKGAKSVGYTNAGTIEFLVNAGDRFYFMEMNTRIQVEHPVTEMTVARDLVKDQILIAAGYPVSYSRENLKSRGHAIECRINAEDWEKDFIPCPGEITSFHIPGGPGIRIDTHVYAKYIISPHYDSLIAKVITSGQDRDEAIGRMERALDEFILEGIKTNIPFHKKVLKNSNFRKGIIDTSFLEREIKNGNS